MDHSIQGYLGRQSTQLLLMLLGDYTKHAQIALDYHVIRILTKILTARNVPIPLELQVGIAECLDEEK